MANLNILTPVRLSFLDWFYESRSDSISVSNQTLIALLGFSALLMFAAGAAFLLSGYHWAFTPINQLSSNIPETFLHLATSFGDGVFALSLMLFLAHKRVPLLLTILIAGLIGAIISQCLKRYFDAARPPAVLELEAFNLIGKAYKSHSFPSGHTLTAFLLASVLICFVKSTSMRIALMAYALIGGVSRVLVGVHWPIDTLIGGAIGIQVGVASVFLARKTLARTHPAYIIFALALLILAPISAFTKPNDYPLAQILISITALLAFWFTIKFHLLSSLTLTLKQKNIRYEHGFYALLVIITAYRILVLGQEHLTLFYDEAYYYHWSLTPDLGYYSKPPMVGWIIALTTSLFSDTVFAVKLAAPILYSLSAYIIFKTGRLIGSNEQGIVAGLVFLSATVIGFNSAFITTDAPLIVFWSLCVYLSLRAVSENTLMLWCLVGISAGLGMLSKYTFGVLPISLFAYLIFDSQKRQLLTHYKPWLAAVIAGLIFCLNLYWNSQNNWVAFSHTQEISQQGKNGINVKSFFEFLIGQIFVLGPIWIYMGIRAFRHKSPSNTKTAYQFAPKLLLYITLGIITIISLQALTSRAFVNWAAPWVVGASLLLGLSCTFSNGFGKLLRIGLLTHLLLVSAFYHWPQMLTHLQIEPSRKNNPYQRVEGWEEMANKLTPILKQYESPWLASNSRDLIAYLGFHAMPGEKQLVRWNPDPKNIRDHYDLKYNFRNHKHSDVPFIFISRSPLADDIIRRFDSAKFKAALTQKVFKDLTHTIYVYELIGFNGYE